MQFLLKTELLQLNAGIAMECSRAHSPSKEAEHRNTKLKQKMFVYCIVFFLQNGTNIFFEKDSNVILDSLSLYIYFLNSNYTFPPLNFRFNPHLHVNAPDSLQLARVTSVGSRTRGSHEQSRSSWYSICPLHKWGSSFLGAGGSDPSDIQDRQTFLASISPKVSHFLLRDCGGCLHVSRACK